MRELEEQRRQAAMAEQERLHLDQAVEATFAVTNADATYEVGGRSSIVNQTYDVGGIPSTPLRNVNQIPSETYELTPHGSDKVRLSTYSDNLLIYYFSRQLCQPQRITTSTICQVAMKRTMTRDQKRKFRLGLQQQPCHIRCKSSTRLNCPKRISSG